MDTEVEGSVSINYKNLLIKYIEHVGNCAGRLFTAAHCYDSKLFNKEEWDTLRKLDLYIEKGDDK